MSTDTVTWLDERALDWTPRRPPSRSPRPSGPSKRALVRRWATLAAVLLGLAAVTYVALSGDQATVPAPAAEPVAASAVGPVLERIAACESGGDPRAVSNDGTYRGKYQFDLATWRSVGGRGDPALAPEREQDRRARSLLAARGTEPWPVCGRS